MSGPGPRTSPRTSVGAITLGGIATVVCILPLFLTGAMAVQMMRELSFGSAALGLSVAIPRATSAALSPFLGRTADRIGATRSLRLAATLAAIAAAGVALTANRWSVLVSWLALTACAQAIGQPAANRLLSNAVRRERLGLAFGIKQSAPPASTMLAGLSVPLVALTLGWRWAYGMAALLAVGVAVSARRPAPTPGRTRSTLATPGRLANRRLVLLLLVAVGLATTASTTITTFYVDAAVVAGSAPRLAGTFLAMASIAAIACRVVLGAAADRMTAGHLRMCAALVAVGSLGFAMLASGAPALMAAGALIGLAGTWGYNSVFWFTLVRAYPDSPGRATGAVAPGALLGATAGPLVFGLIADRAGYQPAWAVMGVVAAVGVAAMLAAARELPSFQPEARR